MILKDMGRKVMIWDDEDGINEVEEMMLKVYAPLKLN